MDSDDDRMPFSWMEGDSLAPPCQTDHDIVDDILKIAKITQKDVRRSVTAARE